MRGEGELLTCSTRWLLSGWQGCAVCAGVHMHMLTVYTLLDCVQAVAIATHSWLGVGDDVREVREVLDEVSRLLV